MSDVRVLERRIGGVNDAVIAGVFADWDLDGVLGFGLKWNFTNLKGLLLVVRTHAG